MSKRTPGLERRKHDAYDTPEKPVRALLPHLLPGTRFIEPCWGAGDLARHLELSGHYCVAGYDIEPRLGYTPAGGDIFALDARDADYSKARERGASCAISNPPWTRELLHAIIENLSAQMSTWLLFDADWPHNATTPKVLLDRCERIVPAGRVKWIPGSAHQGVDNCAWYRFDATHHGGPRFFPRLPKLPAIKLRSNA